MKWTTDQELRRKELSSLNWEIEDMRGIVQGLWDGGLILPWFYASYHMLTWRVRRWMIQQGIPVPLGDDDYE